MEASALQNWLVTNSRSYRVSVYFCRVDSGEYSDDQFLAKAVGWLLINLVMHKPLTCVLGECEIDHLLDVSLAL